LPSEGPMPKVAAGGFGVSAGVAAAGPITLLNSRTAITVANTEAKRLLALLYRALRDWTSMAGS